MKKNLLIALLIFLLSLSFVPVYAQTVNYQDGFAIDSDLDGLTDEGEKQIFNSDPLKSDTDGDGYFDGAEILNDTHPLDKNSFISASPVEKKIEFSWAWYVTRATALMAFFLLYAVIFLGLSIRLPFFKKIIPPGKSFNIHAWLSVQALVFALAHAVSLLFEKFMSFTLASVFVPFSSEYETQMVGLGTVSFYIMILLILSSYFRHLMSREIWRASHFLNIVLYVIVVVHASAIGTDLNSPGIMRNFFVIANAILVPLFVANLLYQLAMLIKRKIQEKRNILPTQEIQQ